MQRASARSRQRCCREVTALRHPRPVLAGYPQREPVLPLSACRVVIYLFCFACELISKNNTPCCLACGSRAVMSLSRVLGGSLRGQQTAHLIADAELDRLVRELLRTVPASSMPVIGD